MRIRFTTRAVYETDGPGKGPVYEAGSEHEMRDDLARRWINRGVAMEVPAPAVRHPTRPGRAPALPAVAPADPLP
jgi:hypothetical protein